MTRRPIGEDDLQGYVECALSSERHDEVEAWLAEHPEAAARLAAYASQAEAMRGALAPVADEPLPAELNLARMIEARRSHPEWRRMAAAALLFAAGLVGGWGGHMLVGGPTADAGIGALAQEAAQNYSVYAPDLSRPVELTASNGPELAAWLSQRMRQPVTIPDLSSAGYKLMGGRLVATAHGPAAMLMYDDQAGTRILVFSRAMTIDKEARMTEAKIADVTGFSWAAGGTGYSLVGPLAPDTLHPIANEVRRQIGKNI